SHICPCSTFGTTSRRWRDVHVPKAIPRPFAALLRTAIFPVTKSFRFRQTKMRRNRMEPGFSNASLKGSAGRKRQQADGLLMKARLVAVADLRDAVTQFARVGGIDLDNPGGFASDDMRARVAPLPR